MEENKPPNRECFLGALVRLSVFRQRRATDRPTLVDAGTTDFPLDQHFQSVFEVSGQVLKDWTPTARHRSDVQAAAESLARKRAAEMNARWFFDIRPAGSDTVNSWMRSCPRRRSFRRSQQSAGRRN
jgi:hypothetical protein